MSAAIRPVTMPKWGIEMTEGTINQWSIREGQAVQKGDPLLEVETEKIINTVEAPAAGLVRRIVASAGDVKPVGSLIAVLADTAVSDEDITAFIANFKGASVSFDPEAAAAAAPPAGTEPEGGELRISPIAKRLADSLGIEISQLKGTGRNGRISKEDVEAFVAARGTSSAHGGAPAPVTRQKMSATRATIARRLQESKQTIPHYRLTLDVTVDGLQERRKRIQAGVSLNDMLVRACALALVRHPIVNAQLDGDEILQFAHADIAIAVATDSGLITPIVRRADQKSAEEIASETKDLASRARRGALTREEITGGTFTVSNLGMYGLASFDAIINPPQVAILAAGAAREGLIVRAGAPAVARLMTLTLSADHRVVDGAQGAAFLATLKDLIEAADRL